MDGQVSWVGQDSWWLVVVALLALAVHSVRVTIRSITDDLNLPAWASTVSVKVTALIVSVALSIAFFITVIGSEYWILGAVVGLAVVELGEPIFNKVVRLLSRRK